MARHVLGVWFHVVWSLWDDHARHAHRLINHYVPVYYCTLEPAGEWRVCVCVPLIYSCCRPHTFRAEVASPSQ